jgi:GNAT superfamily N-acetyltransferase
MSSSHPSDAQHADIEVRAICAEDRARWLGLMRTMSWATRFKRGARRVEDLDAADIERAVHPLPGSEVAIVALTNGGEDRPMVGVARATHQADARWEFTIVTLDEWQRQGIGARLMRALVAALGSHGARELEGEVLASNLNMLDFVRSLGFTVEPAAAGALVRRVVLRISPG